MNPSNLLSALFIDLIVALSMLILSISVLLASPKEYIEFLFIKFDKTSLFLGDIFFESLISFTKTFSNISFFRSTQQDTTGPHNAPLPTSSTPIM